MTENPSIDYDLRSRIVALEQHKMSQEQRTLALEAWQRQADIFNARRDEQFKRIESDLQKISGTLSRIMWLIIAGIVTGAISFILSGGLRVIT